MRVSLCIRFLAIGLGFLGLPAFAGRQIPKRLPSTSILVTSRQGAVSLQEALKELSRSTGVSMAAAPDVAELKLTILVKDLPLDVVQARIAEAFHLTWKQQEAAGDRPASMLLYRSPRDGEEEEKLRVRGEKAFRKAVEDALGALTLSPEARAGLLAQNKRLAATVEWRGAINPALSLFSHLTPQQRTHILDGERLEFSTETPPAELTPYVTPTIDTLRADTARVNPQAAATFDQKNRRFSFERIGDDADSHINLTFSAHDEKGSAAFGYAVCGIGPAEVYPEFYTPNHKGADYAEARLPVDIPMPLTSDSLESLLTLIADAMHINLIGESYYQGVPKHGKLVAVYPYSVPSGLSAAEKALDTVMPMNTWWKQGSVYLFQRPLWWKARQADVSNSTQLHLMQILGHAALTFEDGAEICKTLSPEQFHWLSPRYLRSYVRLQPLQNALRFFGYLSQAHLAKLFQENGMEASGLEEADQKRLNQWLAESDNAALEAVQKTPGRIRVMAMRPSQDVRFGAVILRVVYQPKDGDPTVLREQRVLVTDPSEQVITSEDPPPP